MLRRIILSVASVASLAIPFSSAMAQPFSRVDGVHLSFVTPSGIVGSHDPIDVFIRLSVDLGAAPFSFDGSANAPFGLDPSLLPTTGTLFLDNSSADFASYTGANTTEAYQCSGTFTASCTDGPPYHFNWGTGFGSQTFSLNPGEFQDFLFGTFVPDGGTAPAGLYTFYDAEFWIYVSGQDVTGEPMFAYIDLAETCGGENVDCAFTRRVLGDAPVTATPEPATFGLLGLGLGFIGLANRRRRANRS